MRVQHNIMAMNAYRNYNNNSSALSKNLEKLSSGYAINRAGDDAAGLAISEKMRAQITGLDVAQDNAKDGVSLVQTAEGALTEVHDMLNRMYELSNKSANGTFDNNDRTQLQKEMKQLMDEIDRIADSTNFNGIDLLNGDLTDVQTTTFTATKGSKAGVDLSIGIASYTDDDGKTQNVSVSLSGTTGNNSITISATGALTIKLKASDITSDAVKELLAKATVGNITGTTLSDKEKKAVIDAINNATVTGAGITKGTGTAFASNVTKNTDSGNPLKLQIGDTSDEYNQLNVAIKDMHSEALGIKNLDISDQTGASGALDVIKAAINYVSDVRGTLGATQNRLEHTMNNLSVTEENITSAESSIRDTDVADEMMAYTKNNILIQSAQAMLAQANQVPQGVLQLLQ